MKKYKCHWCQYRHGGCPHNEVIENCQDFKIGGCYSCKYYYGKYGKLNDKETEQWFKRGCEAWFPSSLYCSKRKRLSRRRKKKLKKLGLLDKVRVLKENLKNEW